MHFEKLFLIKRLTSLTSCASLEWVILFGSRIFEAFILVSLGGGSPKWPKMFGLGLLGGSWLFFVRKLFHKYERPSCWASRKNCNRKINLVFTATNPSKNISFNFLVQLSVGEELFRKFLKNPSALGNNALVHIVGTAKQLFGWERFHWTILTAIWKIQCLKNISAKL